MKLLKKQMKGITLISLVITIIILLILAGVTLNMVLNDGIFKQASNAKEQYEMGQEKEQIQMANMSAIIDEQGKAINVEFMEKYLRETAGNEATVIDIEDGTYQIIMPSKRVYEINENNNVIYIGMLENLKKEISISVSKESDNNYRNTQVVATTIRNYMEISDENISLKYAWIQGENKPKDDEYIDCVLLGNAYKRTADVSSYANNEGTYYLWLKILVDGKEIEKKYGIYNIREHDTLANFSNENTLTSTFLGKLQRDMIKSITITNSTVGHTAGIDNCWDVSYNENGKILAWYEETVVDDNTTYYDVWIGQNGRSWSKYQFKLFI